MSGTIRLRLVRNAVESRSIFSKVFFVMAAGILLLAPVIGNFIAQTPQPSSNASPSPSASASTTPTPARTASPTPMPGAQNSHRWGSITVFNGLPSDTVRAIAQTPDGVMWFGTDNGLARFDGRRIQKILFGSADANSILVLATAPAGVLWAGTQNGAFVQTDSGFQIVEGTQNIAVTAIAFGADTFLGTDAGQVFRIATGTLNAASVLVEPLVSSDGSPLRITSLIEIDGVLHAGTPGRGVFGIKHQVATELPSSPRPLFVNSIAKSDKTIWLGTDAAKGLSGVYKLENVRAARLVAPTADVRSLTANDSGIWAGTDRYGLFHFTETKLEKTFTFENTSGGLRSNTIYTLFTDREGVIWIGTNRGVSRFDRFGPFQETISDSPNSNFIRTLFQSADGTIYAGSNRGLYARNGEKWSPVAAYSNRPIHSISQDRSGKLLVDTDERTGAAQRRPPIDIPGSGTMWKIFDAAQEKWIAAEHGVFRVRDGQSEKIIAAEDVRDVFVKDENIWAATTTRGLLHARHDEQFGWLVSAVGFEQGLPSEKAFSILPVKDGLLIATNRGVVTYKPGTVAPKLIATRLLSQRDHNVNELRSTVELEFPQNSLLFEVAGQSSRTFPEEFQYSFLLKNSNGEILDSRLSSDAQYAPTDLKPGRYSIESRAFDRDLLSSEPLIISFSIGAAPFPWTATALGVLLLIAVVALIWAIVERRNIILGNRELAAARFDLANEAERERSRIARDLHDQTLADLRNLMIMSDKLVPERAEFRSEIEAVSVEIRRICEDLSPSVLENVGLVAALEFLLGQTVENSKFFAPSDIESSISFSTNVQLQIYRIAQEVLTNIRTHSDAEYVEMKVGLADGEFELVIADNGSPFKPDDKRLTGRGISNVRSRANLIGAAVDWKDDADGGNVFSLKL